MFSTLRILFFTCFIGNINCFCQNYSSSDRVDNFSGFEELNEFFDYLEKNSPKKKSGYLEWSYPKFNRGKLLATPLEEDKDKLEILSAWNKDEPVLTFVASSSDTFYDRIRMDPSLTNGWEVRLFYSNDSLSSIERIKICKDNSCYEIYKSPSRDFFLKIPLNESYIGFVEIDSTFKILKEVYIWDKSKEEYKLYFPFVYTIGDLEQVFVNQGDYWFEIIFSLFDAEIEAIAKHEGLPGNMKEILINGENNSSSSFFIELDSSGNKLSRVDANEYLNENKEVGKIHTLIGEFIKEISKSYLLVSTYFDIDLMFDLPPKEIINFSDF